MRSIFLLVFIAILFYCSEKNVFKKLKQTGGGDDDNMSDMIIIGIVIALGGGGVYIYLNQDKKCNSFTCPENSTPIEGNKDKVCKDGTCTLSQCCACDTKYTGQGETCVDKPITCNTFTSCGSDKTLKPHAETITCDKEKGCNATKCCVKKLHTCKDFSCPANSTPKGNQGDKVCNDGTCTLSQCCDCDAGFEEKQGSPVGQWVEKWDPVRGAMYYVNTVTKKEMLKNEDSRQMISGCVCRKGTTLITEDLRSSNIGKKGAKCVSLTDPKYIAHDRLFHVKEIVVKPKTCKDFACHVNSIKNQDKLNSPCPNDEIGCTLSQCCTCKPGYHVTPNANPSHGRLHICSGGPNVYHAKNTGAWKRGTQGH